MKVEVYDPSGNNIEHTGSPGELVCTRPHPSLPLYFWGDKTGEKLRDAYFSMYPGAFPNFDGVLNPSGVRFGSGEVYSVMEKFTHTIDDSLCIGQRRPQDLDERVLLFLKMRPGTRLTPKLGTEIKAEIRSALSARHVPKYIFEIEDIPVRSHFQLLCKN
ncbi:hypothetical protein H0H87_008107 [Tephrocybe sp. NHM501043]|nr:hypothetical protein H0H87_008107 [Tephrocybe sp. NHM501043]